VPFSFRWRLWASAEEFPRERPVTVKWSISRLLTIRPELHSFTSHNPVSG
jgi:hypothetical protein